jgi:hypothetical protein
MTRGTNLRLQYDGVRLSCPEHPHQKIERGHPNFHTTVVMKCWASVDETNGFSSCVRSAEWETDESMKIELNAISEHISHAGRDFVLDEHLRRCKSVDPWSNTVQLGSLHQMSKIVC